MTFEMDREYFNKYAQGGYSPYTLNDIELFLSDLMPHIKPDITKWICEVGSADGQLSFELVKRLPGTISALGIDIAEKVLRLYPFNRVCGDAFKMPFDDNAMDVVCYPATLHHLFPFEDSLSELNRCLSAGGVAFFLEPNYFHPQRRFFMSNSYLYHLYRQANDVPVNPDVLQRSLESMGFDVVSLRYVNIHFKSPGFLQSIQNTVSKLPHPLWLERYIMPWFVMIATKQV